MTPGRAMIFGIIACGIVATGFGLLGYRLFPVVSGDSADIGRPAPFVLRNLDGAEISDRDLQGKLALVYFATSACPERCVLEFDRLTVAVASLGARGVDVRPVFITLDPIQARTERVSDLIGRFDARTLMLTGTPKQLDATFRLFGINATSDGTGHRAVLLGRNGEIAAMIDPSLSETGIAKILRDNL